MSIYYKKINIICIFFAIITYGYIFFSCTNISYQNLWVLPSIYVILSTFYFILVDKINYKPGIIFCVMNTVIFARYVLVPLCMVLFNVYDSAGYGKNPLPSSINTAFILMSFELFIVYVVNLFVLKTSCNKKRNKKNNSLLIKKTVVIIFVFSYLIWMFVDYANLFELINSKNIQFISSLSNFDGAIILIENTLKLACLFVVIKFNHYKYEKSNKKIYIILSWFSALIYILLCLTRSRLFLIFTSIIIMNVMLKLYPKIPKSLIIGTIVLVTISFFVISFSKFFWITNNSSTPFVDLLKFFAKISQEYFSGPRNVAIGIEMKEFYGNQISYTTFANDIFGSVPGISNFVDQTNRTYFLFNRYLSMPGNTQLIPQVVAGYIFCPIFPWIFSAFFSGCAVKIECFCKNESKLEYIYIFTYLGCYFSIFFIAPVQSLIGAFFNNFLVIYILLKMNDIFIVKRR